MAEYLLPDVGEGLTEAEIVTWKVKVGDVVAINDVVVEIETAKSLVELPSPYAGTVTALLVPEGETVAVGTPIIAIGEAEIDLSNPAASGGGEGESLVGRTKADRGAAAPRAPQADRRGRRRVHRARRLHDTYNQNATQQHEAVEHMVSAVVSDAERQGTVGGRSGAAPRHAGRRRRRSARRPGAGQAARSASWPRTSASTSARSSRSGPGGTVTRADVEGAVGLDAASPRGSALTRRTSTTGARETREPIKGVRKMMAGAMVQSAFTAPHVTEWVTLDATGTMEFVERLKKRREFKDVKVSPLLVLARAVMLAMRRTPEINSYWDEAAQEVVFKHYVNLGIAAATPRGLVVPNVKDAQDLSLLELAGALNQLTATARDGKTQPAEMSGGTFTITNVGVFGVDAGTPIINPGESAILCFGAIKKQPWVVERRDRRAPRDHAGAGLRPPAHRRREGLAVPRRRGRDRGGPGRGAALLDLPVEAAWSEPTTSG